MQKIPQSPYIDLNKSARGGAGGWGYGDGLCTNRDPPGATKVTCVFIVAMKIICLRL